MIRSHPYLTTTALGITLVMSTGCAQSPPEPPPPPAPEPAAPTPPPPSPAPEPEPQGDWRDIPLAPGTWVYREDDRGSIALFGPSNSEATFLVRCNSADRRIYFSRSGNLTGGSGTMVFQATHGTTSYTAQNSSGAMPYIVAVTGASDDYLDNIAFSRGRITVSVTGQSRIAIPNWPQMTRVFEDCRG